MKTKIVSIMLIIIMLYSMVDYSFAATKSELQNQKNTINDKKEEVQEELEEVKTEISETMQEIEKLNESIEKSEEALDSIQEKMDTLQKEIDQAKADLDEAQEKYDKQQDQLEDRIVAQYKAGTTTYLDVLLKSSSLTNFISNYYLVGQIAKYDQELLDEMEAEKIKIEETKASLESKQAEYKQEEERKKQEKAVLDKNKQLKTTKVTGLTTEQKELQKQIDEYNSQIKEVENEIKKLMTTSNYTGGTYTGGQLEWPIPGYYKITSYFGGRTQPVAGASTNHKAIDIGTNHQTGKTVIAAESGKVIVSKCQVNSEGKATGYGQYIVIDHGNGYSTTYAHLSSRKVSVGTVVSRGQTIGLSGNTGTSSGPHLHFGVSYKGTPVDPLDYVTAK